MAEDIFDSEDIVKIKDAQIAQLRAQIYRFEQALNQQTNRMVLACRALDGELDEEEYDEDDEG